MIYAEDLSKNFGAFWAVDGVNIDVRPGQILALLGQNGAGKTTTIRMLTSILIPSRGFAKIAGHDVQKEPEKVRSLVGVLTEQHGLYLRMTGEEYLDFYGRVYGLESIFRKKRCTELFAYFDLDGASRKKIGEYSKGMRQKLALARSLLHSPPVLLLDEPTSAMDPESARLVRDAITKLRNEDRAIVICTHNLAEAETLADNIAIIFRGHVLVSGSKSELKDRFLGRGMYDVTTRGHWVKKCIKLPPGIELKDIHDRGARFRIENPHMNNPVLLRLLLEQDFDVITIQEVPRTLEEVYIKTMEQAACG